MTAFARKVAELTGVPESRLERLAGGDLSEVLLVPRGEGAPVVAKGGPNVAAEAAMLSIRKRWPSALGSNNSPSGVP